MSRGTKKFLYGLFYLVIAGFVLFLIFAPKLIPSPPPACANCNVAEPLAVSGAPQIFKILSSGKAFAAVLVVNPNQSLGTHSFSYTAEFVDGSGNAVGTESGSENILPSESKYLLIEYDGSTYDIGRISTVNFKAASPVSWSEPSDFLVPTLTVSQGPFLTSSTASVVVSGTVENASTFSVPAVLVVVFVNDKYGDPIFASRTLVTGLQSFGNSDFHVYMPAALFSGIDLAGAKPQVYLYPEE